MIVNPEVHALLVAEYAVTKDHPAYLVGKAAAKKAQAHEYAATLYPKQPTKGK